MATTSAVSAPRMGRLHHILLGLAAALAPALAHASAADLFYERTLMSAAFLSLGLNITPSAANFILVHFPLEQSKTAADAFQFLMGKGIIARGTAGYGLPHALRFTIGTAEENRAVIAALREFLAKQ